MAEKALQLQTQIRENNNDVKDFLTDLNRWESQIKDEDRNLKSASRLEKLLPPIRTKKLKIDKPKERICKKKEKPGERIKSYDYNAWDKFDAESACKESSENEDESEEEIDGEEQEKIENERRVQQAIMEKEKGNQLFKDGKYEVAIERYTNAVTVNPTNPIFYANRAMALIKVEKYGAAERDCTDALALDPRYAKALARRATAREKLNRPVDALDDYLKLIEIEPHNKQASYEKVKLEKLIAKQSMQASLSKHQQVTSHSANNNTRNRRRSNKPLRRIRIEEIGKEVESVMIIPSNDRVPAASNVSQVFLKSRDSNTANHKHVTQSHAFVSQPCCNEKGVGSKLTVPSSSFIFETEFKHLKSNEELLYEYIKMIPTSSYSKLFSQCIDTLISSLVSLWNNCYLRDGVSFYNEIEAISKVPRFEMAAMFLSRPDKQTLQKLFSRMTKDCVYLSKEDLIPLAQKYGLKL